MRKLLHYLDLTEWFEKYGSIVSGEKKKLFTRTVYTLSVCAVAIIFIWYCGIINFSSMQPQKNEAAASDHAQNTLEKKDPIKSQVKDENVKNEKTDNIEKKQNGQNKEIAINKTIYKGKNSTQLAITFDDGYNKKIVEKVLDILKKNNIKTTFFIIGKVINAYPEVWKRAVDEGHQVCNHTNYHEILTNMPDDRIQDEIIGWETTVKKCLGEDYLKRMKRDFPYIRLPGGGGEKSNRILSIAQKDGYTVIGWNLETFSSIISPLRKTHTVEDISKRIEQHVVSKCSNGSIILLHFNQYDTGNVEGIIKGVKQRGFDIRQVSEIIK